MVQLYVGTWPDRKAAWAGPDIYPKRDTRRPALRLHRRSTEKHCAERVASAERLEIRDTASLPQVRLLPIVQKPLQPFVLRESACAYLECKASDRRCLASGNRDVELGYQVAYCLGPRHASCAYYRKTAQPYRSSAAKRLAYAAAVLVIAGLLALAAFQAVGLGSTAAMGRAVGLG